MAKYPGNAMRTATQSVPPADPRIAVAHFRKYLSLRDASADEPPHPPNHSIDCLRDPMIPKTIPVANKLSTSIWSMLLLVCLLSSGPRSARAQEPAQIEHSEKEPQNWLTFYGNYQAWSYSSLSQITRKNVGQLVPSWAFPTGLSPSWVPRWGLEAAPLVMDGVLYLEGPQNNIYAIDAATGEAIWTYVFKVPERPFTSNRGARGLAMGYGMIYMGTQDNRVIAVNAKTGKEVWNTEVQSVYECGCGITSPVLLVKDKVVAGVTGGDRKARGYLSAFDAKTGKLVWRFYPVPEPGEPRSETFTGD
jgi:glucose dehydrogenase